MNSNRSLPLGYTNPLFTRIVPQDGARLPMYEFYFSQLDLTVAVEIIYKTGEPQKLRLRYTRANVPQLQTCNTPQDIKTGFWRRRSKDSARILHLDVAAEWVGIAVEGTTSDGNVRREFFFAPWKDFVQNPYTSIPHTGIRIFRNTGYIMTSFQFVSEDVIMISRLPMGRCPAAFDFYNLQGIIDNDTSREPQPHTSFELDHSCNNITDLTILRNDLDICSRWVGGNNAVRIVVVSLQFKKRSTPRNLWPHTLLVLSDVGLPPSSSPPLSWASWSSFHQHMFIEGPDLKKEKLEWINVVNSEIYIPGEYEVTYQFGSTLVRHFWMWDPSYGTPAPIETHHSNVMWPYIRRQRYRGARDEPNDERDDIDAYDISHPANQPRPMTCDEQMQELYDNHTYRIYWAEQTGIPVRYHAKPHPGNRSM